MGEAPHVWLKGLWDFHRCVCVFKCIIHAWHFLPKHCQKKTSVLARVIQKIGVLKTWWLTLWRRSHFPICLWRRVPSLTVLKGIPMWCHGCCSFGAGFPHTCLCCGFGILDLGLCCMIEQFFVCIWGSLRPAATTPLRGKGTPAWREKGSECAPEGWQGRNPTRYDLPRWNVLLFSLVVLADRLLWIHSYVIHVKFHAS